MIYIKENKVMNDTYKEFIQMLEFAIQTNLTFISNTLREALNVDYNVIENEAKCCDHLGSYYEDVIYFPKYDKYVKHSYGLNENGVIMSKNDINIVDKHVITRDVYRNDKMFDTISLKHYGYLEMLKALECVANDVNKAFVTVTRPHDYVTMDSVGTIGWFKRNTHEWLGHFDINSIVKNVMKFTKYYGETWRDVDGHSEFKAWSKARNLSDAWINTKELMTSAKTRFSICSKCKKNTFGTAYLEATFDGTTVEFVRCDECGTNNDVITSGVVIPKEKTSCFTCDGRPITNVRNNWSIIKKEIH